MRYAQPSPALYFEQRRRFQNPVAVPVCGKGRRKADDEQLIVSEGNPREGTTMGGYWILILFYVSGL
jgi:hypothetical protein